jgi:hypothetical protein
VDGVEDVRVRGLVEVVGPHHTGRRGDRLGLEHHCAEQRLLGREVVGRDAAAAGPPGGRDVVGHGYVTFSDTACG